MKNNFRLNYLVFVSLLALLIIGTATSTDLFASSAFQQQGQTYYVDCNAGNDSNPGTSMSTAWRTLGKVGTIYMAPGDSLLFKRGCVFSGQLKLPWHGTASNRIYVGAYGDGNRPLFRNTVADVQDKYHVNVRINGSYITVDGLEARTHSTPVDPSCSNQPIGFYVGFSIDFRGDSPNSGKYNIVQNSLAADNTIGIHLTGNTTGSDIGKSQYNQVLNNIITNNGIMHVLTSNIQGDDLGAWGMVLNGDNNEIAYNTFEDNSGICTYDNPGRPGNSIEVYAARNNTIHHNISINDRVFSELGSGDIPESVTENNLYAYNIITSSESFARFIVSRGQNDTFGPVNSTRLFNNTIYYTGNLSQGIVCGGDCNSSHMIVRNNIVWAEEKAIFADDKINEFNNLYWNSAGDPFVQLQKQSLHSTSKIENPRFTNPDNLIFTLANNSPAIDTAGDVTWIRSRNVDVNVVGSRQDIGACEFGTADCSASVPPLASPTPSPTSPATQTPQPTATATQAPAATPTATPDGSSPNTLAFDTFDRSVSNSWGSANSGGAYTHLWGSSAKNDFDVTGGQGVLTISNPSISREAILQSFSGLDTDIYFQFESNKSTNSWQEVKTISRRVSSNSMYRTNVRGWPSGLVQVSFERINNGSWSRISNYTTAAGVSFAPNSKLNIRTQTIGTNPTTLRVRVWNEGDPEPSIWHSEVTDSTSRMQSAGAIGFKFLASTSTNNAPIQLKLDNLYVTVPQNSTPQPTPTPVSSGDVYWQDSFSRTTGQGWGTSDIGGEVIHVNNTANRYSTNGSQGIVEIASSSQLLQSYVDDRTATDSIGNFKFQLTSSPSHWHEIIFLSRQTAAYTKYQSLIRVYSSGSVTMSVSKLNNGSWSILAPRQRIPGISVQPNKLYNAKISTTGSQPTNFAIKVWEDGTPEPANWQFTTSDSSSPLTAPGLFGFQVRTSSSESNLPVRLIFDDVLVVEP